MFQNLSVERVETQGGGINRMNYLRITKENIDKEHICCAMSNKQSIVKRNGSGNGLRKALYFTGAKKGVSALLNIFRRRTRGCRSVQKDTFISIACGSPAL